MAQTVPQHLAERATAVLAAHCVSRVRVLHATERISRHTDSHICVALAGGARPRWRRAAHRARGKQEFAGSSRATCGKTIACVAAERMAELVVVVP